MLLVAASWLCGGAIASPALAFDGEGNESQAQEQERSLSKKARELRDKASRPAIHAARPASQIAQGKVLSLHNLWTHEVLPLVASPGLPPDAATADFDQLARCHHTNQGTAMDPRLLPALVRVAERFGARVVEIVSGYRAAKYQLMLRKKGHEVARDSEHPRGEAIDFRLPDIPTRSLVRFVRSLRIGGVGYYPESRFVHLDVGRLRSWRGR